MALKVGIITLLFISKAHKRCGLAINLLTLPAHGSTAAKTYLKFDTKRKFKSAFYTGSSLRRNNRVDSHLRFPNFIDFIFKPYSKVVGFIATAILLMLLTKYFLLIITTLIYYRRFFNIGAALFYKSISIFLCKRHVSQKTPLIFLP